MARGFGAVRLGEGNLEALGEVDCKSIRNFINYYMLVLSVISYVT